MKSLVWSKPFFKKEKKKGQKNALPEFRCKLLQLTVKDNCEYCDAVKFAQLNRADPSLSDLPNGSNIRLSSACASWPLKIDLLFWVLWKWSFRCKSIVTPHATPHPRNDFFPFWGWGWGGGYIGITLSVRVSLFRPDDIAWIAQPSLNKLDTGIYYH